MPQYFEFEVSLGHVTPRVWRRFLLRRTATFQALHHAIQEACGWENAHLFEFRAGGRQGVTVASIPDEEGLSDPVPDARTVRLAVYFGPAGPARCFYLYDFGDGWEHDVHLRGTVAFPETFRRRLLDGQRAFPPEDCGSYPGYARCVQVAHGAVLTAEEWADGFSRWLGAWDPEAFDLAAAQKVFDG